MLNIVSTEIIVEVAYALPREQVIISFKGKLEMTIKQAIIASEILSKFPEIDLNINKVGIFGKLSKLDKTLTNMDRIEIYRELKIDPKETRKLRASTKRLK